MDAAAGSNRHWTIKRAPVSVWVAETSSAGGRTKFSQPSRRTRGILDVHPWADDHPRKSRTPGAILRDNCTITLSSFWRRRRQMFTSQLILMSQCERGGDNWEGRSQSQILNGGWKIARVVADIEAIFVAPIHRKLCAFKQVSRGIRSPKIQLPAPDRSTNQSASLERFVRSVWRLNF